MRPLLFIMPAWVAGLIFAPFVVQFILQFDIPRKWRLGSAAAGVLAVAAVTWHYRDSSIPIHAYGVMLATAAVVGITVGVARAPVADFPQAEIVDFGLYVVLWGVVGARAFHVVEFRHLYFGPSGRGLLDALAVWNGGLVFYGGIIGAMLYSAYFALRRKDGVRTLVRIFDLGAPCVMFGLALGRVGCFLNGCCYGGYTTLPWGVAFPQGSPLWRAVLSKGSRAYQWRDLMPAGRMHTFHVHPHQLYASLIAFTIGIFLSWAFYKKWRLGTVSVLTLFTYPVGRFILEGWLRGDTPRVIEALPFTISQYVSLVAFGAGIVWAVVLVRAKRAETARA